MTFVDEVERERERQLAVIRERQLAVNRDSEIASDLAYRLRLIANDAYRVKKLAHSERFRIALTNLQHLLVDVVIGLERDAKHGDNTF